MTSKKREPIFTAEDFGSASGSIAATLANAKIERLIADAPRVWLKRYPKESDPHSKIWAEYEGDESVIGYKSLDYTAVLFDIQPIQKERVEHEPIFQSSDFSYYTSRCEIVADVANAKIKYLMNEGQLIDKRECVEHAPPKAYDSTVRIRCVHCNKELKAVWKVEE